MSDSPDPVEPTATPAEAGPGSDPAPGLLQYRAPRDEPVAAASTVLQAAVAIGLGCFSVLLGAPGIAWLVIQLPREARVEWYRVWIACAIVVSALAGVAASVVTARDYFKGRNQRPH